MEELDWANIVVAGSFMMVCVLVKVIRNEKPNNFVGYRTRMSKLNQATWKMANESFSNGLLWTTLITISIQIFFYLTIDKTTALLVSSVVFTASIGIMIILTEAKLRKNFNKDGSAKAKSQF